MSDDPHVELQQTSIPTNEQLFNEINVLKQQVAQLLEQRTDKKDNIENTKNPEKQQNLFEGSTHSHLIYYENISWSRFIIAVIVLSLEIILLFLMLVTAIDLLNKDLVNVQITYQDCFDKIDDNDPLTGAGLINTSEDTLVCDVAEENFQYATLSFILMACFVMSDFFASFEILFSKHFGWQSKLSAAFLLIENLFAAFVASLFAFQGVFTGSGYDALVNTVGVLFIHDLDEKVYQAANIVNKQTITCKCFCCLEDKCRKYSRLIYVLLFIICMIGVGFASIFIESAIDPHPHN
eukprot:454610_1